MNLIERITKYFSKQKEVVDSIQVVDKNTLNKISGLTPTVVYIDECNDVGQEQTESLRSLQEADKGVFESFNNGMCPETYPTQVKHYSSVNNKLTFVGYITKQQDIK